MRHNGWMVATAAVVLVACTGTGDDDSWNPGQLLGIWVSHENPDGSAFIVEMKEFDSDHPQLSGVTPVYFIARKPAGGTVEVTQFGQYDIRYEDGVAFWVTMPIWSIDGAGEGGTYGNEIFSLEGDEWRIESGVLSSGIRTMERVSGYP